MRERNDISDRELAALLAKRGWEEREFAYVGDRMTPEAFARLVLDTDAARVVPEDELLERAQTVLRRHAYDHRVAFMDDDYSGPPAEKAFIVTEMPSRAMLAFHYAPEHTARIHDFIRFRCPELVPDGLEERRFGD